MNDPAVDGPTDSIEVVLTQSQALGLLGPGPIELHLDHARGFAKVLASGDRVLDLGSGGGLPGLVIGMERRDVTITLVDAGTRRVAFLRRAVRQLGISARVEVVHGRAETLARRPELRELFDVVVARSFAVPAVTAECAAGFVRVGGRILVSEPPDAPARWDSAGLQQLGLIDDGPHRDAGLVLRILNKVVPISEVYPRSDGVPERRPLFT